MEMTEDTELEDTESGPNNRNEGDRPEETNTAELDENRDPVELVREVSVTVEDDDKDDDDEEEKEEDDDTEEEEEKEEEQEEKEGEEQENEEEEVAIKPKPARKITGGGGAIKPKPVRKIFVKGKMKGGKSNAGSRYAQEYRDEAYNRVLAGIDV